MSENIESPKSKLDIGLERIAFFCECWHPDHNFFVLYDRTDDEVTVQVKLNHWLPWYKRVWVALKYILGVTTNSGDYDEVLLSVEDRKKLAGVLLRAKEPVMLKPDRMQQLAGIKPKKKNKEQ